MDFSTLNVLSVSYCAPPGSNQMTCNTHGFVSDDLTVLVGHKFSSASKAAKVDRIAPRLRPVTSSGMN